MTDEPARDDDRHGSSCGGRDRPPIWTAAVWGLGHRTWDVVATGVTLLVLLATRFLLLPSGPWEWDETLFARGILRFDLHAHFPHPPGFPLWILLGKMILPLVDEPLRGLQILSALASCLTLWPLAAIGRRVAPAPVAAAASVAVLLAPGVWLHAVRGFSSTPAAFLALWAAALAVWGLDGRRVTAFTLLITAAVLVRPILLPSLALLWLACLVPVRPVRRAVPGALAGSLAVFAAVAGMVAAQGSWSRFAQAFFTHGATHARNLVLNVGGLAELGLVKGLGGIWQASALAVLAVLGLLRWRRRVGIGSAICWLLVLGVGVAEIVWLQNRTFSRYAVPFQLGLAPLVAAGASALAGTAVATAGVAALGVLFTSQALPPVRVQHVLRMPAWDALLAATEDASRRRLDIVVEPGLYPFLSYLEEVERQRGVLWQFRYHLAPSSPDASTLPSGPYLLVTDFPHRYLSPPFGRTWRWRDVPACLRPLTQRRFLDAAVIEGAPLPRSGWWIPESGSDGSVFMWGAPGAALHLPPYPAGTAVRLDLCPSLGPAPLTVMVNGCAALHVPGELIRRQLWIDPRFLSSEHANVIRFDREAGYHAGPSDTRSLAVRLFGLDGVSSRLPWAGQLSDMQQRERLRIRAQGLSGPENFAHGRGAWTDPATRLWFPAEEGALTMRVWAPRPHPPDVEIFAAGKRLLGPFKVWKKPAEIEIPLPADAVVDHGIEILIRATPYVPAREGNPRDPRELGIVVGDVRFRPAGTPESGPTSWLYPEDRAFAGPPAAP